MARHTYEVSYSFRVRLPVAARPAFRWCTDFGPGDAQWFSRPGRRQVRAVTENILLLTDIPRGRDPAVPRITRLVHIDPRTLSWTNTHVSGPRRHSQFWYRIHPEGPQRSSLEFWGHLLLRSSRPLTRRELRRVAAENRREDSRLWRRRLVPALRRDLHGRVRSPARS
jgi:hypothetical protein